ncbi:MAG: hypothetical protein DHS20C21_22960 [Gemmatimonadota bacterium]|nr:MAG: hypothetical protein DHS20C21_22960 [Gemmatimonadota bacterium]
MTLKVRLAVMMIILLVAVMALQALLMQREQRVLVDRLEDMAREIDETTRGFSESTLQITAEAGAMDVHRIVERVDFAAVGADSGRIQRLMREIEHSGGPDSSVRVVVLVEEDSTHTRLEARSEEELMRLVESEASPVIQRFLRQHADFRVLEGHAGPDSADLPQWKMQRTVGRDSTVQLMFTGSLPGSLTDDARGNMFKIHLPYPATAGSPGGSVELLYPAADIAEELANARRRSWLWLAGLLGVGATGAVALAFQFTRPIRRLETSFGQVVGGDLEVRVEPERPDEIGRLTQSFNLMVSRLREKKVIEERLSEAERLAAVGQLAAGVAHEVRNPLNAMRLTMGQLGDKTAPPAGTPERESFDRYVGIVTSELARLERLVSTFLDLSREDTAVRERVDVTASLRDSLQLLSAEARDRRVDLVVDVADGLELMGDPGRLPTVWNNLITNALNAVESGGTIHVLARQEEEEILLEVRDDGAGIDPAVLPRIWEPFFSGRSGGTGLGLSLVRAIVDRHGGRAEVTSQPGEGTCLRVWFPSGGAA